jgi:glycine amidinotransferase
MIYTEFDPLEEVIVGDCYNPGELDWALPKDSLKHFNKILEETKEDLNNLSDFLKKSNIKVYRPNVKQHSRIYQMPNFSVEVPICPIVPRDQYLILGKKIIQTYTSYTDRYFDSLSFNNIFLELFQQGYDWVSMPPPMLKDLNDNENWFTNQNIYTEKLKDQILWHTATMFKAGDTLIVNTRGPGSQLGLQWIKNQLPDFKIIENKNTWTENYGHIDHGFILIDDETVINAGDEWVPECLKSKKQINIKKFLPPFDSFEIYKNKFKEKDGQFSKSWIEEYFNNWRGYDQKCCFDLNVLILDSKNVIFGREIPELFKFLKSYGIESYVIPQRHILFWEGGPHCLTLDVKRKGKKRTII